jgi:hypothetical protein
MVYSATIIINYISVHIYIYFHTHTYNFLVQPKLIINGKNKKTDSISVTVRELILNN